MKTLTASFSFKVPKSDDPNVQSHPDAGKKISKVFEYQQTESEQEAQQVLTDKKWTLQELVDEALKANSRSNAYQAALLPYRPSEKPVEEIQERIIRDYIRSGIPEEMARAQVTAMFAAQKQAAADTSETSTEELTETA